MHEFRFNKVTHKRPLPAIIIMAVLVFTVFSASAQEKKRVEILQAGSLVQSEEIANAQRLLNDVIIKHEGILMYCDSAYTYEGTNRVDAFGHVHINQADTLHLYAEKVFYDGDRNYAQAIHHVKFVNKGATLYTDTLDYDMEQNIAYYNCGGTIVDSTNTLMSNIGKYYLDEDMAHFTDSVVGLSEKYTLNSEDVQYNTKTKIIYFIGPTTIRDSSNTLYAKDGWYDTNTGAADLRMEPYIYNDTQLIKARQIIYDKESGDGKAIGNAHVEDYENHTIVEGNDITYNDKTEMAIVTDSAVFISYNDTDSLYLHADTLRTIPDTVDDEKVIKAYYGVRFYRSDVQGICDSLAYFTKDSLVQLFVNPVLWSEVHQLSADRIELRQHINAPDEMYLYQNSFIIAEQDSGRFDQIKGKNMTGYVVNGELNHIDVDGNGQTLYYAREKNEVIGINRAESSNITIRFKEGRINKIIFQKKPEGDLKPLLNIGENEKFLSNFNWQGAERPKNKEDIFRKPEQAAVTSENPTQEK